MRYEIGNRLGDKEGDVVQVKQATSLRVDQGLYDRLARLARDRGTSITRQLEMAIHAHVEAAVVSDYLPVMRPHLEDIINVSLESTITAKIDEVKERLAGLLARNAMDTAVLYLMETRRWTPEERQMWRKAAADHVRGRLAEIQGDAAVGEELSVLRNKVAQLTAQLQERERLTAEAATKHRAELDRLKAEIDGLHRALAWRANLMRWLEGEWDKQGLLGRRKPFHVTVAEFEQQTPRPQGA